MYNMVEREKQPIQKHVTGFDYGISGVIYHRGKDESSVPSLWVPNKGWSNGIHLQDNPTLMLSIDMNFTEERQIDEKRSLLFNDKGEVIGVIFQNSKDGAMLDDLPLSDDLISEGRDLLKAYHEDHNPEVEDYWEQKTNP